MPQFLLQAWDHTDDAALDRRMAVRENHMAYADQLRAAGKLVVGGAILSDEGKMIGSTGIYDFPDRAALDAMVAQDPYVTGNVWERITILPFRVAPIFSTEP